MNFKERDFIPMLFGGDINTYSVARAFYEEYQVKTYVFKVIKLTNVKALGHDYKSAVTAPTCTEPGYTTHTCKRCGDSYVALISKHKNELPKNTIAPYIDFDLMNSLQQKETFYKLCEKHGVDYPGTIIHNKEMGHDFEMNFPFPVILKPSDSIQYWEHPFDTQKKVYTIKDKKELEQVLDDIYGAGYTGKLIIQDMIPGNDEYMRVLTSYSDHNGKVKMMCLGHVLLEEHTPHGLGNHAVIITEPNKELMMRVKDSLKWH